MYIDATNYASDIKKLRELEFGDRFEPTTRLAAIALTGVLLFFYMDSLLPVVWAGYFLIAFGAHASYLKACKDHVSLGQLNLAALLFVNFQGAYAWLPTLLFVGDDRTLYLVGASLICAQLLFMARRTDTITAYNTAQVLIVSAMCVAIYVFFSPSFETPLAYIGGALALFAVVFYFVQTIRVLRRVRESREAAAVQAHQAQKMAAIGQLAGGVAHDFNNNLTAIAGSLELMQLSDDPKEQRADLDNALIAARQAATTVKHLMIFARMEKPSIMAVDLRDLFGELGTLTQRLIPTSVAFRTKFSEQHLRVRADRGQLLSGLINLAVNGVDAMPNGGHLTIEAKSVSFTERAPMTDGTRLAPGDYVQISVEDTGHGIPPNLLPKVLDPFFTTKAVGKGTGLGLSMVSGMLQESDGGLVIRSSAQGTQVSIFLPRARLESSTGP